MIIQAQNTPSFSGRAENRRIQKVGKQVRSRSNQGPKASSAAKASRPKSTLNIQGIDEEALLDNWRQSGFIIYHDPKLLVPKLRTMIGEAREFLGKALSPDPEKSRKFRELGYQGAVDPNRVCIAIPKPGQPHGAARIQKKANEELKKLAKLTTTKSSMLKGSVDKATMLEQISPELEAQQKKLRDTEIDLTIQRMVFNASVKALNEIAPELIRAGHAQYVPVTQTNGQFSDYPTIVYDHVLPPGRTGLKDNVSVLSTNEITGNQTEFLDPDNINTFSDPLDKSKPPIAYSGFTVPQNPEDVDNTYFRIAHLLQLKPSIN